MALEESGKNGHECLRARKTNGKYHEMALKARIDNKGATCGVHGRKKLDILNDAQLQLRHIIPMLIIHVLSEKRNGELCLVGIQLRHIQIVDEVQQSQRARWSIVLASLLLQGALQHASESTSISVEVEIHHQGHELFGERAKFAHNHCSLAGTGQTNEQRRVSQFHKGIKEEGDGHSFARWHSDSIHRRGRVVIDHGHH
mmetsp:Transcript_46139/g.74316  ORF Transcript_46139/g.74316 Transcript_46139/m.74316 type:complete len:200 (-) Transcript_46139:494-1093(-)